MGKDVRVCVCARKRERDNGKRTIIEEQTNKRKEESSERR